MAGTFARGAYNYSRFDNTSQILDPLMASYKAMYEEKCENEGKEEPSFLKKSKDEKDSKKKEKDDEDSNDEDSDSDEKDEKDEGKKLPPWLKGKKDVKESVIAYLIHEGFANNEVSAEIISHHMSEEWTNSFLAQSRNQQKELG